MADEEKLARELLREIYMDYYVTGVSVRRVAKYSAVKINVLQSQLKEAQEEIKQHGVVIDGLNEMIIERDAEIQELKEECLELQRISLDGH